METRRQNICKNPKTCRCLDQQFPTPSSPEISEWMHFSFFASRQLGKCCVKKRALLLTELVVPSGKQTEFGTGACKHRIILAKNTKNTGKPFAKPWSAKRTLELIILVCLFWTGISNDLVIHKHIGGDHDH